MKKSSAAMHGASAPRRSAGSSSQETGYCRDGQCPAKRPFLALVSIYRCLDYSLRPKVLAIQRCTHCSGFLRLEASKKFKRREADLSLKLIPA